jgi:DNA-binding NarL/FixJ family response regulator
VQTALSTGAEGYVHKVTAGRELIPALSAILQGKRFVSSSVRQHPEFPLWDDELCKTAV